MFWLGLAANFTVMGSEEPGGLWPLKLVIASSASDLLSNRIKATPLDKPFNQTNKQKCIKDKLKTIFQMKKQKLSTSKVMALSSTVLLVVLQQDEIKTFKNNYEIKHKWAHLLQIYNDDGGAKHIYNMLVHSPKKSKTVQCTSVLGNPLSADIKWKIFQIN